MAGSLFAPNSFEFDLVEKLCRATTTPLRRNGYGTMGADAPKYFLSRAITLRFHEDQPEEKVSQVGLTREIPQALARGVVVVVAGDLEGVLTSAGMDEKIVLVELAVAALWLVRRRLHYEQHARATLLVAVARRQITGKQSALSGSARFVEGNAMIQTCA